MQKINFTKTIYVVAALCFLTILLGGIVLFATKPAKKSDVQLPPTATITAAVGASNQAQNQSNQTLPQDAANTTVPPTPVEESANPAPETVAASQTPMLIPSLAVQPKKPEINPFATPSPETADDSTVQATPNITPVVTTSASPVPTANDSTGNAVGNAASDAAKKLLEN
jgi:outer membrane biosynthesis protein TonB